MRQIAALLRRCHVFLFSQVNPPCPNAVLEAVATGLPVVSFDSGSAAELLPFSTELLAPVASDNVFQQLADLRAEVLADKITLAVENLPRFQSVAREHANDYAFARCGYAYREVFARVLNGRV
ncbi:glycosyltransferase [Candidatus Spongiihabitans sp.]|uniref:glycosyltransferase n=1 Tax=Candidatus Spongiihabitans sp. TaxID=3101308 RepID=UPI003C79DC4F